MGASAWIWSRIIDPFDQFECPQFVFFVIKGYVKSDVLAFCCQHPLILVNLVLDQ